MTEIAIHGLEVEAFDVGHSEIVIKNVGVVTADAAPDLKELVGEPGSLTRAIEHVRSLAKYLTADPHYIHKRPTALILGKNVWRPNDRYSALRRAVLRERPEHGHGVSVMTNRAATHHNQSIDWDTPAGAAWISVMNNIAPKLAMALHLEHGLECDDLLSPWQGWARKERFADPDRWFESPEALRLFYESVPRLIRDGTEEEAAECVEDLTDGSGTMEAKYHLGTMWHFARPKIAPNGSRYCELRVVGSINPWRDEFESIVSSLAALSEAVVSRTATGLAKDDAADLFADLRQAGFNDYVPEYPMTWKDWDATPVWTTAGSYKQAVAAT